MKKAIYYRIEKDCEFAEIGHLFTEKELKKEIQINRYRPVFYKKVSVYRKDIYFIFGARISDVYTYI